MSSRDYERIEQAIGFLEQNFRRQPALAEVARAVGLSEFHFQRLFKRWAGVSPKRFLQYLTVESAKQQLRDGQSVLHTAYEVGLSGPSRLHDLFVTVEAVTPGQFREPGRDLRIAYGFHETPFGECLLSTTNRGVCGLAFVTGSERREALQQLHQRWGAATISEDRQATGRCVQAIFPKQATSPRPVTLFVRGTNFQLKVWQALLALPMGTLASYQDVARAIGHPDAERAVGAALAVNPIAYVIPCHRVIRSSGSFGDYRWGSARKRALIGWEAAQRATAAAALA